MALRGGLDGTLSEIKNKVKYNKKPLPVPESSGSERVIYLNRTVPVSEFN